MSTIQIPNLPVAITLTGAEEVEIVQAGVSVRTTTGAIANALGATTLTPEAYIKLLNSVPNAPQPTPGLWNNGGILVYS